jgi:hypothetical protein
MGYLDARFNYNLGILILLLEFLWRRWGLLSYKIRRRIAAPIFENA